MDRGIEIEGGGQSAVDDGRDGDGYELRLMSREEEPELGLDPVAELLDPIGLGRQLDERLSQDPVLAQIGEPNALGVDARGLMMTATGPPEAPHLEDVREVGRHRERDRKLNGVRVVVLHPDPLEHPPVDRSNPPDVEGLLGDCQAVTVVKVRVRQIDVRHVRAFRGGREQDGLPLGNAHVVMGEEPGIPVIQTQAVLAPVVQVSLDVRIEERLPLLDGQHLVREVGQEGRDGVRGGGRREARAVGRR